MNDKLEMTPAEAAGLKAFNQALTRVAHTVLATTGRNFVPQLVRPSPDGRMPVTVSWLHYEDGVCATFNLKPGQNSYLFYQNRGSSRRYCYTPWKDSRDWYWYWNDILVNGIGGKQYWETEKVVKVRTRKLAASRALTRYSKEKV